MIALPGLPGFLEPIEFLDLLGFSESIIFIFIFHFVCFYLSNIKIIKTVAHIKCGNPPVWLR